MIFGIYYRKKLLFREIDSQPRKIRCNNHDQNHSERKKIWAEAEDQQAEAPVPTAEVPAEHITAAVAAAAAETRAATAGRQAAAAFSAEASAIHREDPITGNLMFRPLPRRDIPGPIDRLPAVHPAADADAPRF